jgi:hypothetical protein
LIEIISDLRAKAYNVSANKQTVNDQEFVRFLKWCLSKPDLCWPGFRKTLATVRKIKKGLQTSKGELLGRKQR